MIKNLFKRLFPRFRDQEEAVESLRYVHHPHVVALGKTLYPAGGSREPVTLNGVGEFIWKQLEMPATAAELVSALISEFAVDATTAVSDVESFLTELLERELACVAAGSVETVSPDTRASQSTTLLSAAFERQEAGDWRGALSLCIEARHEAEHPGIVELNILICRHRLGATADISGAALALVPSLPPSAQLACWGLAMLSAHRAGDVAVAKAVACELAQLALSPWDLPSEPNFVCVAGEKVFVVENRAVTAVVEVVQSLQTCTVNTREETALLKALEQHYKKRVAA